MGKYERHEHSWIFEGQSCCYRLTCPIPGCERKTTVRHVKGDMPKLGEAVRILDDGDTMECIGGVVA